MHSISANHASLLGLAGRRANFWWITGTRLREYSMGRTPTKRKIRLPGQPRVTTSKKPFPSASPKKPLILDEKVFPDIRREATIYKAELMYTEYNLSGTRERNTLMLRLWMPARFTFRSQLFGFSWRGMPWRIISTSQVPVVPSLASMTNADLDEAAMLEPVETQTLLRARSCARFDQLGNMEFLLWDQN